MDVIHESPFLPHGLLVSITTYTRLSRFSFRVLRTSRSWTSLSNPPVMSLQRLYDLDKTFADELDKLLHDAEYVDELGRLPERELVQLVNHLNNVSFSL